MTAPGHPNTSAHQWVVQLLLHRLANPSGEGFGRRATQFTLNLARLDCQTPVMAMAVLQVVDLRDVNSRRRPCDATHLAATPNQLIFVKGQ